MTWVESNRMTSLSIPGLFFASLSLFLLLVFFVVVEKCTFSGRKGRKNTSSCGRDRVRQTHRLFFVSLRRDSLTWLQIYFSIPFLSPQLLLQKSYNFSLSLSSSPFSASIEAFKYSKQTCCGKKVTFLSVIITTTLIMSIKLFTLSITSFIITLRRHRVLPLFLPMDLLMKEWLLFLMEETQGSIILMLGWLLLPIRPRMKPVPIIPTLLPVKIDAAIPTKRSVSEQTFRTFSHAFFGFSLVALHTFSCQTRSSETVTLISSLWLLLFDHKNFDFGCQGKCTSLCLPLLA